MKSLSLVAAVLGSLVLCLAETAPAAEGASPASPSGGGMEKLVVARVNGVGITMASVAAMMQSFGPKTGQGPASPKTVEEAKTEALNQLILQELAWQKAKSEGLVVGQEDIDAALADLRRKLGGEEKFQEVLARERVTEEELRKRIERTLTLQRVFAREVQDKVSVSGEEAREEYEKEKGKYARPEKIVVIDVVFFLETGNADSRKKAEGVLKRIQDDGEQDPWDLVSDGTFVVRDLEIQEQQEKELFAAAKKLKVGELSGVFSASGNLHILKLTEYSPRRQFTFEEVKGPIEKKLMERALRERLEQWGAELKKGAKIEILATAEHQ